MRSQNAHKFKLHGHYDDDTCIAIFSFPNHSFTQDEKSRQMEAIKERVRARSKSPHASREGSFIKEEEVSVLDFLHG